MVVNDGGAFVALGLSLPAPISSVGRGGAFTWLDLDGDGDLDYLVAGAYYVPGGNGLVEARPRWRDPHGRTLSVAACAGQACADAAVATVSRLEARIASPSS